MKLISKSELMSRVIQGHARECFEHSEQGIFDITAMREWAKMNTKPVWVLLSDINPFIRTNRVTELERVNNLPRESWESDPGMFILIGSPPDETHVMVDGHHRALRREMQGEKRMLCYVVPIAEAKRPQPGWYKDIRVNWGDDIVNGAIVKRVTHEDQS